MENIKANNVFKIFEEISKIPRESGNEKGISDYIYNWAKERNLNVVQDEHNNIVIKKPAHPLYKDHPPVLLQAHTDMVCEKTPESTHDFEKDPILLKQDGDWIISACGTSLGADNGIGVAAAMSILDDVDVKHPPIEVALTISEETTFEGAESLSPELFDSVRMINLDHAADNEIIVGSCGGVGVNFRLPISYEPLEDSAKAYRVDVTGLTGGHSGEDIHRGRGNAIELITRLIRTCDYSVAEISGGTNRLAIPREAMAIVVTADEAGLREHVNKMADVFAREYVGTAPELNVSLTELDEVPRVLDKESREKALTALTLFPDGITAMNGGFPNLVESSNNLGILRFNEDEMVITTEIRGMYVSTICNIRDRVEMLGDILGAQREYFSEYVPWEFSGKSEMRETALDVYRDMFGGEMLQLALHAGLECGYFMEKKPGMDIISIGPNCQYFHSVNERVSISSTVKFYNFLKGILEKL